MKGGYRKCDILKEDCILKERCIALMERINFLEDDRDFWHKNSDEYRKLWRDEFDMRLKARSEAEKWKKRFACAGGCGIGFAVLWFCEAFIF